MQIIRINNKQVADRMGLDRSCNQAPLAMNVLYAYINCPLRGAL